MAKNTLSFIDYMEDNFKEMLLTEDTSHIDAISTDAISLDISTGIGGIPRGRITEMFGPESSGKTTIALSIVKNALKAGMKVLYDDPEFGIDFGYVKSIVGEVDSDNLVIFQPETAEEAFQIAEKATNTGEFGLVVLDSLGALAPVKEKEDEFTDANVGLLSRLLTKWCRRNAFAIHKNNVAMLFINQVRDKIGAYVPTLETPGGRAIKHFSSLRIQLSKIKNIEDSSKNVIGISTKFSIKKNKMAPPFRSYIVPIIFGKGIDKYMDLIGFCKTIGVIEGRGSYYYFEGTQLGQGVQETAAHIESHKEVLDKITEMAYNRASTLGLGDLDE